MRDLTKEELEDYFEFVDSDLKPSHFTTEQAVLIGKAMADFGIVKIAARNIMATPDIDCGRMFLSQLVWAFQMGRECESRLLTAALKAKL